jgi:hypothetical protein
MIRIISLVLSIGLASPSIAGSMAECLALRGLSEDMISKARRAESSLANEKCPEDKFRTKLNSVSDWAWETNTGARQLCRERWKENTDYSYKDLFGNGYRSAQGIKIAKDLEVLGLELSRGSCPVADLTWQPENEVRPKMTIFRMSWEEKLNANPSLQLWAQKHPSLAEIQRQSWESLK